MRGVVWGVGGVEISIGGWGRNPIRKYVRGMGQ